MGNGGYFYIRSNDKTKYLFASLLLLSDSNQGNEQYQLNNLMAEHASTFGMKVKVLLKHEFPTGAVFHGDRDTMKAMVSGAIAPFMLHMSWTVSKKDKLLYFKQMGEWFVEEKCVGGTANSIINSTDTRPGYLITPCCSAKPLISCHFPDKPSTIACNESFAKNMILTRQSKPFW